ncbi:MAG: DinB family protein [Chitinophagales bacterium]|nr:DinB family protein [Chitinophagales bacterium]
MIVPVEKQFKSIEEQRKNLLDEIAKLSHAQQNFKPSPDAWSILQVVNHLLFSETNVVKYMLKKMQGIATVEKAGFQAKVRSVVLNSFLKSPFKFKAPKAAMPTQEEVYIFENLRKQWNETRSGFAKILDQLNPADAEKLIFKHPLSGKFNIYQTMSFMQEHVAHHIRQVARIKAHPNFPQK